MRLGDLDALKKTLKSSSYWRYTHEYGDVILVSWVMSAIDNAPTISLPDFKDGYKQAIIDGKTNFSRPQGEWGKWVISEIRCPNCLEYFQTDCYSTEELKKCPNCGAKMKGGVE